jgi:hypothetical protein
MRSCVAQSVQLNDGNGSGIWSPLAEWAYIKKRGKIEPNVIFHYKQIVGIGGEPPVSWRLFKSVEKRALELYGARPELYPGNYFTSIRTELEHFKAEMIRKSRAGSLFPRIPKTTRGIA